MKNVTDLISELKAITTAVLDDKEMAKTIAEIAEIIVHAYQSGHKAIFCGNGGSAAEAQHLAAELSGKFKIDRKPLPAEACHTNSSFLTAVSNDYNFEKSYARYIEAFGQKNDVLIGLSTSGNSPNMVNAFSKAKELEITTVALTGKSGGKLKQLADFQVCVPSENVPRIQELHLLIGHIICEIVEKELFADDGIAK